MTKIWFINVGIFCVSNLLGSALSLERSKNVETFLIRGHSSKILCVEIMESIFYTHMYYHYIYTYNVCIKFSSSLQKDNLIAFVQ